MKLGNKIYELRKGAKLSQEQLAEKLNVTRQTISNWELGQTSPDIYQAKELSKIFGISLDELTDNDIKDVLVEKIINTEKLTNTAIKMIKFFCIVFICFLIIIISMTITVSIKNKNYEKEKQVKQEQYREYMKNREYKQFYITINDEKYSYSIQYGSDFKPIGDNFAQMTSNNEDKEKYYRTYINYLQHTFVNYTDARERIKDVKQYFESIGGTWEEIPNVF